MSITINNVVYTYGGSTASVTGFVAGITNATILSTIVVFSNTYNVTSIGNNAFDGCGTLTSVSIPNSVITIGIRAFQSCASLSSIVIPNSVTTIGNTAFRSCSILNSVTLPTNALFTTIDINTFQSCSSLASITIPDSMTTISNNAFLNCAGLLSINIPNSVTNILDSAFESCINLSYIRLPTNASYTFLSRGMFYNCQRLASIAIPNSVTIIRDFVFTGCTSLTSVSIPNSVTSIGISAFQDCSNLNLVYFLQTSSIPTIGTDAFRSIYVPSVGRYYSGVANTSRITAAGITFISPISNTIPTLTSITAFTGATNTLSVIPYTGLVTNGNEVVVNSPYVFLVDSITSGLLSIGTTQGTATPWNASTNYIINTSNTAYWTPPMDASGSVNAFSVVIQDAVGSVSSPNVAVPVNFQSQPSPNPCFLEGTKILCFKNNEEVYLPIESLQNGDLVKTIYNGYLPICMMGTSSIYNPGNDYRVVNRLYKCPKENYPYLFEDLYITGCHSILVTFMSDDEWKNTKAVNGDVYVTDNHYRLIACADENAEPFNKEGFMNIYHIALLHYDMCMNYGIYANGLLVESCSIDYLIKYSNMKILGENVIAVCQDVDKVSNNMTRQLLDTY
jgi:hypothetical protein